MPFIFSLLGGAVGKYLVIALGLFAAVTWIRAEAAAPYKREVIVLRQAAADKERLAKANERRAVEAEAERQQFQQRLQVLIDETNSQGNACVFSDGERQRLLDLAAGNR
jgi:hypothetical protein